MTWLRQLSSRHWITLGLLVVTLGLYVSDLWFDWAPIWLTNVSMLLFYIVLFWSLRKEAVSRRDRKGPDEAKPASEIEDSGGGVRQANGSNSTN